MFQRARDADDAKAFLRELQPKLAAWHDYLYRERTRGDDGLVEIWHPWESGMDNSPLWDAALERITPPPEAIPEYQRVDVEFVDAAQRPTNDHYDRYAYLVKLYRDRGYDAERIREDCPFVVRDVLFNSLLAQANRDLAEISRVTGDDPEPYETWADRIAATLEAALWDEDEATYFDYDVRAGELIRRRTGAGFSPLFAGVPSGERVGRLVERLGNCQVAIDGAGRAVASVPPDDPRFEPALYWRGPIWPMINWVVHEGLLRYGLAGDAADDPKGPNRASAAGGLMGALQRGHRRGRRNGEPLVDRGARPRPARRRAQRRRRAQIRSRGGVRRLSDSAKRAN